MEKGWEEGRKELKIKVRRLGRTHKLVWLAETQLLVTRVIYNIFICHIRLPFIMARKTYSYV